MGEGRRETVGEVGSCLVSVAGTCFRVIGNLARGDMLSLRCATELGVRLLTAVRRGVRGGVDGGDGETYGGDSSKDAFMEARVRC